MWEALRFMTISMNNDYWREMAFSIIVYLTAISMNCNDYAVQNYEQKMKEYSSIISILYIYGLVPFICTANLTGVWNKNTGQRMSEGGGHVVLPIELQVGSIAVRKHLDPKLHELT